jgi:hypothetical protein
MSLISEIPNKVKEVSIWLTKQLYAKIAERNSFLMKASRHFIKKKASRTNRKDALPAERQKNNSLEITETTETDTNNVDSRHKSGLQNPLLYFIYETKWGCSILRTYY